MRHQGLRTSHALVAAIVVCQLLWAAVLPLSAAEAEPTALSLLPSGDLVILDADQGLFLLSTRSGQVRPLGQRFGPCVAMDMAGALLDGGESLFVTMSPRASSLRGSSSQASKGGGQTQLVRFNAAGQRTGEWTLPNSLARLSGIAVDPQKRVAYVANTQPPEVYRVDLSRPRTPMVPMPGVRGAERLGSMVLDARRNRLLIADPYLGRVYAYDLDKGYAEVLLEKVGEVGGLALDPTTDRLYIADSAGRRVLVSSLTGKSTAPVPFGLRLPLDEPLGLALGGDGGLWVADKDDEEVLRLSPTGRLVRTYSLEKITPAALKRKQ